MNGDWFHLEISLREMTVLVRALGMRLKALDHLASSGGTVLPDLEMTRAMHERLNADLQQRLAEPPKGRGL